MQTKHILGGLTILLILSACATVIADLPIIKPTERSIVLSPADLRPTPTPLPAIAVPQVSREEQREIMRGFSQLIDFDGIRPVYAPQFVNAADAELDPDELVMGIELDGEAKAYPVSVLRHREMVNDELAGLPILVTW